MARPADEVLLIGLAAGDEQAFATLYDRFGPRMYRTALRILGRREEAEDVVQEVFVALVRAGDSLRRIESLSAYLFAALRRAAGRRAMHQQREPAAWEGNGANLVSPVDGPQQESPHSERLDRALRALPHEQREVVAMKIEGELTFAEIGRVLDVSANTVASRYRYALEKLRSSLRPAKKGTP